MLYSMLIFKRLASKTIETTVYKNVQELPSELLKRGIKCSEQFFVKMVGGRGQKCFYFE